MIIHPKTPFALTHFSFLLPFLTLTLYYSSYSKAGFFYSFIFYHQAFVYVLLLAVGVFIYYFFG